MNLADTLNNKSNELNNTNETVVKEIVEYFKQELEKDNYVKYIEKRCSEKEALLRRSTTLELEFWGYASGCSSTLFRTSGIRWNNPENPKGYESYTYKKVDLRDIQRKVGPQILELTLNKLKDLGFSVSSRSNESWLKYYCQEITIKW